MVKDVILFVGQGTTMHSAASHLHLVAVTCRVAASHSLLSSCYVVALR